MLFVEVVTPSLALENTFVGVGEPPLAPTNDFLFNSGNLFNSKVVEKHIKIVRFEQ